MERRRFIGGAGLAGILAAGAAPVVQAGQATRWRMVSRFPRLMDVAYDGMQTFTRLVRDLSGGRFEIAILTAEELAPGASVLDGVQRGNIECGFTSASYYVQKDEAFALDSAIPFGMNARQLNAWMQHGNGLALLRDFYRSYGLVNFPMGNTGAHLGGWYRKPLKSLADLKGLKMRILGLGGRVLERLGGIASVQFSGETFTSLQKNLIDAAEWGSPYDDLKLGLHDVRPYCAHPGWWKGGMQFSLYINQRAYDALSDANQAIIEAASDAVHQLIQAQYDAKNSFALQQMVATGTHLFPMPRSLLDAAWKAADSLYAELAGSNPHWRKIHASYAAFQQDKLANWGYAETGYDQYMHEQLSKIAAKRAKEKAARAKRR